ncbi:MAG: MmcQ-like protein [Flavobacterium sp.]|uniref:MmcQ/YjbR family DNA-binding protein n=1 Tax=unclassified Flavobacterium TaxID=196869 RepID=UPI000C632F7C|nr:MULTISPECIES: MmcQ/YjbR family DNA-binding protein [unclassified Flavobacterium]MBF01851.1 MmcQ-like protein [Flavobacterium sp.]MCO6161441.1 MmcQ/YjbR family DNA-binding protein [Flavobacterium sp. NRK F7]|tara:strand:- start:159 stop:530 length:372 start_codon:yes stop_codon:yes gene_type:complete
MNIQQLYEYCLSKKGVTEHFPFDEDTLVFKVGGKMFCLTSLQNWEKGNPSLNLKCDPEKAIELRAAYEAIQPGYHMSKKHWNTVFFHNDVATKMMVELINHSYDLVFESLPKKIKQEIEKLEN